jgi:hypothetical protein
MMRKVRGRPRLCDREANKQRAWQPKRWLPEYERIVLGSVAGVANTVLAQQFGFTAVHISNILNTEEAKKLKASIVEQMRANALSSLPDQMERIAAKTVERVDKLLHDDGLFSQYPMQAIDKGFRIMEHLGLLHAKNGPDINVARGVIVMSPESAALMAQAMEKSNEVKRLYPGENE